MEDKITQEELDALLSNGDKVQDDQPEKTEEGIVINDPKASGLFDAFLSGLTNDETYKIRWLAEKRFPELVEQGKDPVALYFVDGEGDIAFIDPKTKVAKKEFKEALFGYDAADYMDNIGPTGQFLSEVIGGTIGTALGSLGGLPGAIGGGATGTGLGGGISYVARTGISEFFGGPPLNTAKVANDLTFSSAAGAIPFGAPTRAMPKFAQGVWEKFPGVEGREALQDVIMNGGKTVDDKIEYMSKKYPDIIITRAEADGLVGSNGAMLQKWLGNQPQGQKLLDFYNDRNLRVRDIAENFFNEILTGKYVAQGSKNKLFGQPFVDADIDVAKAMDDFLKNEKKKLQERVSPIYKEAYDLNVSVDITDVLDDVKKVIADKNVSAAKKNVYKKIEKALIDANTKTARNSTELIHTALKDDFNRVFARLSSGSSADAALKAEITTIRNTIQNRLREVNPSYRTATDIYNEATGVSQLLEKSIVGQFAKVTNLGGTKAASISKKLFSGDIKPNEVKELKNILQKTEEGAAAWQNLKGTWLSTQWDEVLARTDNPLGEPNSFLRAIGVKSPRDAFGTRSQALTKENLPQTISKQTAKQIRGRKAKMFAEILEPDELKEFIDLTEMLQMVGAIQTKAGSDTYKNFLIDEIVTKNAEIIVGGAAPLTQSAKKVLGVAETVTSIPSIAFQGTDFTSRLAQKQKDAFLDLLIAHIVDPTKRIVLKETTDNMRPRVYALSQAFARGGFEAVEDLYESLGGEPMGGGTSTEEPGGQILEEQLDPSFGPLQRDVEGSEDISALQMDMSNFNLPNIDAPAFEMPETDLTETQLASASILPNEKDREIARRLSGGIASLV
jgi:hypothetical protein